MSPSLPLTEHLADVGLDVDVLEVLDGVRVVQPQRRVQPDRHPHTVTNPRHLADLQIKMGISLVKACWTIL